MHADLAPDIADYVARIFDALDRAARLALLRLTAPRRYDPTLVVRALEALVAQLSGYAIGLVGSHLVVAVTRDGDAATAADLRAELLRIAEARTVVHVAPRPDLERELAHPPLLAIDDFSRLLRERLVQVRADAYAMVARAIHVVSDRAAALRVLGAPTDDELAPQRFGERIEAGWRATCEALAHGRKSTAPLEVTPRRAPEAAENYCWTRIR